MVATSRLLQQWVVEIQWHTRCHKLDVYHYTTQNKTLRYTNYDGMYLQLAIIYNLFLLISSGLVFQIFICCTLQFLKNHSTNTLSTTSLRKANKEPLQTSTQKKTSTTNHPVFLTTFSYFLYVQPRLHPKLSQQKNHPPKKGGKKPSTLKNIRKTYAFQVTSKVPGLIKPEGWRVAKVPGNRTICPEGWRRC